jgi:predicted enzyme related to lactoylglutathione lyase
MSEREQYPAGVPCWVDTLQPDPDTAMRFYGGLLGWEFTGPGRIPGDPPGEYFVAQIRGRDVAGVGSQPGGVAGRDVAGVGSQTVAGASPAPAWNTYVSVRSADAAAERAHRADGTVVVPPFDADPAGRMAVLRDPAGAHIGVWEAKQRTGARLVNEPAAWAMSVLNTHDLEGAQAFYAEVFGWEAEAFELGGARGALWRLPGYVGGEPAQPVPRDVVGVALPIAGDAASGEMPCHWSVDFWIDDADAAAAAAPGLGGRVVVPAHDRPGFRSTVLADPHGASFSVSQLMLTASGA